MKLLLTSVVVLFFATVSFAQQVEANAKVATVTMDVVLVTEIPQTTQTGKTIKVKSQEIARLYRYSNSRVKKALSFHTKKDRPKLV